MYQFTDDCKVGIKEIDEEHERLFDLINQATEMTRNGGDSYAAAIGLLKELKAYAATHFAHEESYMEQIHDPELPSQKREHAQFTEKIESYKIEDLAEDNGERVLREILSFMARWLYRHIMGSDIMIGKFEKKPAEDLFAFTDKYKTGISFVDEEHEKLFEIIKETHDVIHAELLHDKYDPIVAILDKLKEYTVSHFTDEEQYMKYIGYEGLEMQKYAHTAFVDRLNEIDLDHMDDNQEEYLEDLIDFLLEWLINHILKMDKKIPKAEDL
jgi:hemerythrin